MKTILLLFMLSVGLCAVSLAGPSEPKPDMWVKIGGEDVPVYTTKTLKPKKFVAPQYPAEEKGKNVNGEALVYALIDTEGVPVEISVKSSQPTPAFGEAATEAVRKSKFQKVQHDGHPTRYLISVPIVFNVKS